MTLAHCGGRTLEEKVSGIIISMCSSKGGNFGKNLRSPRTNNHLSKIIPHPPANRLTKDAPSPRHTATWSLTQRQSPTHQRDKNQLHLPVDRHQSLSSGSLQQAPVPTSATRGADIRSKRGYNSTVCKKETTPKIYTK